ncbi:MAG TPA: MATE family efflux transporter [Chloroflexia bacterium]|jgi:putative MATE family efflux protein|nr:MATE family efflux transporter [Chloroflexia bacterium]
MSKTNQQDNLPAIEPVPSPASDSMPFTAPVATDIVAPELETAPGPTPSATHAALRRQVLALSWPVILENLLQSLIGFVDTAFVGHLGTDSLAGVGGAQQLVWLITTALSAIMMGATVLVAHAIGAQNPGEARRVFKQALVLAGAVAVVISIGTYALAEPAVSLLGMDANATRLGILYLQISGIGMPFLVAMFTGSAALRGAGDTRTPMFITLFINIINVPAAYVLIYGAGPIAGLGVAGSAWAATVARVVGCVLLAWVFLRPHQTLTLREPGGWQLDFGLVRRMLNVGLPTAGEQFMLSFGLTLYGLIVISLGTAVYATQRASMNIVQMAFLPGFGFAMAATTLVGQAMGAGRTHQAEAGTWMATRYCMILMSSVGLVFGLFGAPLMRLFSDDPEVIRLGGEALFIAAWNQPFMAIAQVLAGGLRGAGDTRYPMVSTMIGVWVIRLPLGWLLGVGFGLGLNGIYLAYVLDTLLRAGMNYWRWRTGHWRHMRV